jgi:dTMP kinase
MKSKLAGKFIVFDGPDGCGKSTQSKLAVQWLTSHGVSVETFRDPGDTAIGEKIRGVLLNPQHVAMSTTTEVMLYMAARVQLWNERIGPALADGKCVVLDRWLSSTCAYQGFAGEFEIDKVTAIAQDCLESPWPDLTVILDVDLQMAAGRMDRELDRMEQKSSEYHEKVREGFLELASQRKNFVVIDASGDIESVHQQVVEILKKTEF